MGNLDLLVVAFSETQSITILESCNDIEGNKALILEQVMITVEEEEQTLSTPSMDDFDCNI